MDASSGQQHQDQMGTNSLENMLVCSKSQQQERKPRPQPEQALKCPRCDSTNTKFCYYNNYSLSQPRYFCKSCRRYWTKGGTLRNVPVGGGCRKNKRSSSSSTTTSSTSSASSKRIQDHLHQPLFTTDHIPNIINPLTGLPHLGYDSSDLSLAFERLQKQNGGQMGGFDHDHQHHLHHHDFPILGGLNPSSNSPSPAFLDAPRSGFLETHNNINNNFQNLYYGYGGGNLGEIHENVNGSGGVNGGEMLQLTNYEDHHHHHNHHHQQHHNMSNSNTSNSSNATTTAVTVTTMKQEFCNNNNNISGSRENDNKILWGYPWQLNNGGGGGGGGDHHGNLVGGDLDSTGRESWNGFNSSNWHGLLNSPLM